MDVHVRKDHFFVEDTAWFQAARRYEAFVTRYAPARLALMELGVGFNTPDIIRYPFESITCKNPQATLLRLNRKDPAGPAETASQTLAFTEPMNEVIDSLRTC